MKFWWQSRTNSVNEGFLVNCSAVPARGLSGSCPSSIGDKFDRYRRVTRLKLKKGVSPRSQSHSPCGLTSLCPITLPTKLRDYLRRPLSRKTLIECTYPCCRRVTCKAGAYQSPECKSPTRVEGNAMTCVRNIAVTEVGDGVEGSGVIIFLGMEKLANRANSRRRF